MLSKSLFYGQFESGIYLNWDSDEDRRAILKKQWSRNSALVVLDELHKYPGWRKWIKDVFDLCSNNQEYLVIGSASLDVNAPFIGRYRLHPFTIDELPNGISSKDGYERLLSIGGFPEPFISGDERESRRWRRERFDRIIREDIRDLESIRNLQSLSLFIDALRERVGGMITLANIARDLEISPKTAKSWLSVIEKMYLAFSIYPLVKAIPRAIQKPPKVYFYDNGDVVEHDGARLENLVATTLLKRLQFIEDYYGYRASLHYIRDKDGREVDFVTVINNEIVDLIEVKNNDSDISSSLKYYSEKLKPKNTVQLVSQLKRPYHKDSILVTTPIEFFKDPPWKLPLK